MESSGPEEYVRSEVQCPFSSVHNDYCSQSLDAFPESIFLNRPIFQKGKLGHAEDCRFVSFI